MRDTYDVGDKLVIVTTDRQSAFDRLLAAVPFKGQVLNQTSAWWMQQTRHIVQNALLAGACAARCAAACVQRLLCRGRCGGLRPSAVAACLIWCHCTLHPPLSN